eukprot:GDKI01040231.1.p1 GENE.GDKI01040231.1~~GDKI01040231.1.p1  ORF type:complete len:148 (+),score=41.68 GDKI01040231.1:86-529(+)
MSEQSLSQAINKPEMTELLELPKDAQGKKVHWKEETKVKNAGSFMVYLEDHTLGNLFRMQMMRDDQVLFSGYQIPHPLEAKMLLRVQTTDKTDPFTAVNHAADSLLKECDTLEEQFKTAMRNHDLKQQQQQAQPYGAGGYYGGGVGF